MFDHSIHKNKLIQMKTIKIACLLFIILSWGACKKIDPFRITDNIEPKDFLSSQDYDKLVVEIVYVDGHKPTDDAVQYMTNVLNDRLSKPKGIEIRFKQIPSPGYSAYTLSDIRELEKEYREYFPKQETLSAFILFADADYAGNQGNSKALGIAYDPTSMAIFEKTLRDYSGGVGQPTLYTLEATALIHEFGHLFGLVNNGTAMQVHHQDVSNGHHCTDQSCIMYYAAETTDVLGFLTGGDVPQFDAKCLADIRSNGGK